MKINVIAGENPDLAFVYHALRLYAGYSDEAANNLCNRIQVSKTEVTVVETEYKPYLLGVYNELTRVSNRAGITVIAVGI